ncbi:MAG: protein kinase [Planctomycetaceae bacterium]
MKTSCPAKETLHAWLTAELDESQAARISDHVDGCQRCSESVAEMERDGLPEFELLNDQPPDNHYADEPQCETAIRMAEQATPFESPAAPAPAAVTEPPATQIRDYRLLRILGKGGMGVVYLAVHVGLNRQVALKLLHPSRTKSSKAIARFRREIEAMGRFNHPNLVRAADAGEYRGQHFLVMDVVDGCDLSRLLRSQGSLTIPDACEIVKQAALGLQHIHEHGLVHRDIAPSNLMLTREGTVKVTDLGLALLDDRRFPTAEELTETGQVMGTLDYMAPEQAVSTEVDIRADVYGLGATLFKLLTGKSPLDALNLDTPLKKAAALPNFEAPDVTTRRSELPPELASLVNRMLNRHPEERPSQPVDVAAALEPFTAGCDLPALSMAAGIAEPDELATAIGTDLAFPSAELATTWKAQTVDTAGLRRAMPIPAAIIGALLLVLAGALWTALPGPDETSGNKLSQANVTNASTITPPAQAAIQTDREVAVRVLEIGGEIDIADREDSIRVTSADDLPQTPFRLVYIMLAGNPQVDDEFLEEISGLRNLVGLTLQHTRISDRGVHLLGQVKTLSDIYLYGAALTDEGVEPLTQLSNLLELVLSDTKITDLTLQRLADQQHLRRLFVKGTRITDAGLKFVGQLESLEELDLRQTSVTDSGLAHLSSLTSLESLSLSNTGVTDDGLSFLKDLRRLQTLYLVETAVTEAGVDRLLAAIPDCEVVLED